MSNETRTVASAQATAHKLLEDVPQQIGHEAPSRTEAFTILTQADGVTRLIRTIKAWTIVRATLITGGPVDIGTKGDLAPVQSGQGREMITGQEVVMTLAPGDRLTVVSNTVNRVAMVLEPPAYLDQIVRLLHASSASNDKSAGLLERVFGRILARGQAKAEEQPATRAQVCLPANTRF